MEDQLVRFDNAVNLHDVLLLASLAYVRNHFHYTLTPGPHGRRGRVRFGHTAADELGSVCAVTSVHACCS